ncbi:MAG: hypothetical protein LDL50_03295 [Chloroflexi bacterium]|nr:hypothetical protein [Chloroflexota bacterium]
MTAASQAKMEEINLQERAIEKTTDNSLPASQVLEERNNEEDQQNAPLFIP